MSTSAVFQQYSCSTHPRYQSRLVLTPFLDLYGADDSADLAKHEEVEPSLQETPDTSSSPQNVTPSSPLTTATKPPAEDSFRVKTEQGTTLSTTPLQPIPADSAKRPPESAQSLSYSAQIARQFSAYHQTPSQERQQRSMLPPNPMAAAAAVKTDIGPSAIASYESRTDNEPVFASVDRPIRPSEMKDEG